MKRKLLLVAAISLLTASCGAAPTSEGGAVVARPLAYSLGGSDVMAYHTELETEMTMTFGEEIRSLDPSMPSSMTTEMAMEFDTSYQVDPGPEAGTYRISMTVDGIDLTKGSVEMGNDRVDLSDMSGAELDAALTSQMPEFVYVIDDKGAVVSVEIDGASLDIDGLLGGTSSAGFGGGQMFGPELPEGTVSIGDTWTTTSEQSIGETVIVTDDTHKVIRREERNGRDAWVIRTDSTTSAYTINWDDMVAMFEQIGGIQNVEGMEDMPPSFQMAMRSSPTATTMLTWLDPERGEAVAVEMLLNMAMTMEIGGLPGINGSMSMTVDGYTNMTMELTE